MEKAKVVAFVSPEVAKQYKIACVSAGTNMSEKAEELFSNYVKEQLEKEKKVA
jgi:hypothetical protein